AGEASGGLAVVERCDSAGGTSRVACRAGAAATALAGVRQQAANGGGSETAARVHRARPAVRRTAGERANGRGAGDRVESATAWSAAEGPGSARGGAKVVRVRIKVR